MRHVTSYTHVPCTSLDTQETRFVCFVRGYSFLSHYDRETLMRTKGFLLILIAGLGVALICPELSCFADKRQPRWD